MRFLLTCAAVFGLAAPMFASDKPMTQAEADARAAMAFVKARANRPAIAAQTKAINYADALKVAKQSGKPIFVTVACDCGPLCSKLRPEFLTVHEAGSKVEARLEIPAPVPGGWIKLRWDRLPSEGEVKSTFEKHKPRSDATTPRDWDSAVAALLVAMTTSVEFAADDAPPGFVKVCENGVCRLVPVGFQAMPAGSGPVAASPPAFSEMGAGGSFFRARFPRVARFRQNFRATFGLPAPVVRGAFFQAIEADLGGVQQAAPTAKADGPQVVGAGRERRLLKLMLKRAGLSDSELDSIQKKADVVGDSIWSVLIEILIKHGLAALREFLDSWLNK